MKIVLGENLGGEEFQRNADVFGTRKGRHEVKILDVQGHEVGIIRYSRSLTVDRAAVLALVGPS
jgi:hypothetical protein